MKRPAAATSAEKPYQCLDCGDYFPKGRARAVPFGYGATGYMCGPCIRRARRDKRAADRRWRAAA